MNIRHRIVALVLLTLTAIAGIGGYSVLLSNRNAAEVKRVTEGIVPSALASGDLVSHLKDVQLATIAVVTAPDENLAKQSAGKLSGQIKTLQDALELQLKSASSEAQKGLVTQAKESAANYVAAINDTVKFKLAGQKEMAEANLYAGVAMYQEEIGQIVDTLRIEKGRAKDEAFLNLNQNLAGAVNAILLLTVLAVLILGGVGVLLYRQVIHPIGRMQQMMSDIATHQDFSRRIPVEKQDEIGNSIVAFNVMIEKIQQSSELLKQKTNDIQTMLQNIPQGILTITAGNKVHHEYSAYLETILETDQIAGAPFMDLIFSDTSLGVDGLAQVEAAISSCIGEDVVNFEFNEHLLVSEIERRMPDGSMKILDLDWSPITDGDCTTLSLMLCVRDVTELRKLAVEAQKQKQELEMIGEVLGVSQEKFHEFACGALEFIDRNEVLLMEHTRADADAVAQLFRNMHTIKGNARTYGLKQLTNVVHAAEQNYDELRQPHPAIAWDQGQLLAELAGVRAALERYIKINDVSLGRKGPGRRGSVERYLMVDKEQIQQTIQRLEAVNKSNLHELLAAQDAVRQTLRLLGTEPIAETLAGVLDSLPSLARELDKEAPQVTIADNRFVLRSQVSGLVKNVFMHLLRNALDHGLETAAVRLIHGKSPAGNIQLKLDVVGDALQIHLRDDGRGLALKKIRDKAVEKQLIGADAPLADEEIAQQIFRPGFSTADAVTEVSGRGVGMDAVQDFVRREQGRIEIRFTDNAVGADFRQFETIVYLPASLAEHVDGNLTLAPALARAEAGQPATAVTA